jgi:hypothetical protein
MRGACSTHGEKRNACSISMIKPKGKRPLGTPGDRCEDNIEKDP